MRKYIGFYAWAFSLGAFVLRLKSVIARVLFPVFAKMMRDGNQKHFKKGLTLLYRTLILLYGFITPAMVIMAPRLVLLAGKEWIPAIACLQIAIFIFSMRTFNSFLEPVFVIYGKSNPLFGLSILNGLIIIGGGYLSLLWFPRIESMALIILLSCIITFLICSEMIRRLSSVNLIRIITPGSILSFFTYLIMYSVLLLFGKNWVGTGVAICVGAGVYLFSSRKTIIELTSIVRRQLA